MGGPKRDMELYVFKDKPDQIRCCQCALYYSKDQKHICPAQHTNVISGDIDDVFGAPKRFIPPQR